MLMFVLKALGTLVIIALIAGIIMTVMFGYVKAPTDRALIITGLNREPKVLIGQAGIRIPYFQRADMLLLKQISVDIKTSNNPEKKDYIPTMDFIGVDIDAVAKVKIRTDPDGIKLAMTNFLNMNEEQICHALTDSLQGNMREIIGTVKLKDLCTDRKKFGDEVQAKAQLDMNKLGIEIISCNIQKIEDEKGLIVALGQDNMSQIQKDASIAKAQAERDVAIAEASAKEAANDAQVKAEAEIAKKNNDLEIQKAELKKMSDTKKAEADAAYKIQEQEQEKAIQTATVNAQIAKTERESELKEKEVEVTQRSLEATVNKQADADKYAKEQEAAAELAKRQRDAEARFYEQQQEAKAKRELADAERYSMEQEAEGIKARGEAEAKAIEAKGIAEAQAMEKKAEAMQKYGQAAMLQMIVEKLPEMAQAVAEPLGSIDKVTIIDGGNSGNGESGVSSMGGYVPDVLAKTIESVKETTGLDITEIMKANTYDAKVNKNLNVTGLPEDININKKAGSET